MSEPAKPEAREAAAREPRSASSPVAGPTPCPTSAAPGAEAVVCERCGGASVYRMHAVWRCADCGYKTDCCGW